MCVDRWIDRSTPRWVLLREISASGWPLQNPRLKIHKSKRGGLCSSCEVCALLPCVFSCLFSTNVCVFVRKRPVVSCSFAKFVIRQVLALTDAVDLLKRSVDRKTRSNEADQAQPYGGVVAVGLTQNLGRLTWKSFGFSMAFQYSRHCFDWSRGREDQVGSAIIVLLMRWWPC